MIKKMLVMLFLLLGLASQAEAADPPGVILKSGSEVEVTVQNDKGENEVILVDAAMANVVTGDTVIYTNYYENQGALAIEDVVLVNPVPEHMVYVAGSAEGEGTRVEFSVDQGKSYGAPEELKIKDADGKERGAGPADYTHIRWIFAGPIAKGEAGKVLFRAKVK
jgi:uncharacterized repeat protein (TIGR01451 family)